uniref:Uncharacterized protein n=1 Tax=Oryza meridionalis TaxID=40149 RepID=A0A0E0ED15_9ORYZ
MELLESACSASSRAASDSYTRKSTFDSMLAGCISVFLHPASAYNQYTWHLPRDRTTGATRCSSPTPTSSPAVGTRA